MDESLVKNDVADYIPDVYTLATLNEDSILVFDEDYRFNWGDKLSLILEDGTKKTVDVSEVIDPKTIRISQAVQTKGGKLFVYGRYQEDVLSIQYDAMVSVSIAALKNLDNRLSNIEKLLGI